MLPHYRLDYRQEHRCLAEISFLRSAEAFKVREI
jgi:hypothetical protein